MTDVVKHQATKLFFFSAGHFHYCEQVINHPSYGDKKPSKQSRKISEITDTVFHDEHHKKINNLQEGDCDHDDECTSSGSGMNSSEGE